MAPGHVLVGHMFCSLVAPAFFRAFQRSAVKCPPPLRALRNRPLPDPPCHAPGHAGANEGVRWLSERCRAALRALGNTDGGAQTVAAPDGAAPPLSLKEARAIQRTYARGPLLPACRSHSALVRRQRAMLRDMARALEAEWVLEQEQAAVALERRFLSRPGASVARHTDGGCAVALGAVITLSGGLGAGQMRLQATGEDLSVADIRTCNVSVSGKVAVDVAPGLAATAETRLTCSTGTAHALNTVEQALAYRARTRTCRRLSRWPALLSRCQPGETSDPYEVRWRRALRWQEALPVRPGHGLEPGDERRMFDAACPRPVRVSLRERQSGVAIKAKFPAGKATGKLQHSERRSTAHVPTRLTDRHPEGPLACRDAAVGEALARRMKAHVIPPWLWVMRHDIRQADRLQQAPARGIALRRRALAALAAELDHIECWAALRGRRQARGGRPVAALVAEWGATLADLQPVLVAMLDSTAWLQALPAPARDEDPAGWDALQDEAWRLAERLHLSPAARDRGRLHRAVQALAERSKRESIQEGTLTAQVGGTAGASVSLRFSRREREDPNPLRAGTYWDLSMDLALGIHVGALLAQLPRLLAPHCDLPASVLDTLEAELAGAGPVQAGTQLALRLFAPAFQQHANYPDHARGYALQWVRLSSLTEGTAKVKAALPLAPGVALHLSAGHAQQRQQPVHERLCSGTVTGPLLRYVSLLEGLDAGAAWTELQRDHADDLAALGRALADAGSTAAAEVRFLLRQGDAAGGVEEAAPVPLQALFDQLVSIVSRMKKQSPLYTPAVLR